MQGERQPIKHAGRRARKANEQIKIRQEERQEERQEGLTNVQRSGLDIMGLLCVWVCVCVCLCVLFRWQFMTF